MTVVHAPPKAYGRAPVSCAMVAAALRETPEGVLIDVDVRPGAAQTRITGHNAWRHSVTVDVAAPPEKGAANRALVALFRGLGGDGCTAEVVRGAASRHKTVRVRGVPAASLVAAIERAGP